MQIDWKKISLIIGFLIVVGILTYALWWVFFRSVEQSLTPAVNDNLSNNRLPNINDGSVNNINIASGNRIGLPDIQPLPPSPVALGGSTDVNIAVSRNADFAVPTSDNQVIYYDRDTERVYKISEYNKEPQAIATQRFPKASKFVWSPKKDEAIISFPDGSKIMYDFDKQKQYTLPKQWDSFDFSSAGNQVIFRNIESNSDYNWLSVANPDGTGATLVEHMGKNADKVQPAWSPQNNIVAFYHKYVSAEREEIIFVGLHGENYASLTIDGQGFKGKWSPSGLYMLYEAYSAATSYKPNIYVVAGTGSDNVQGQQVDLGVNTWIDKCLFATDTKVYCAVPKELPVGSAISPSIADTSDDVFYEINLVTGRISPLASLVGSFNVKDPFLSADKKKLYFRDSFTGYIFNINLP